MQTNDKHFNQLILSHLARSKQDAKNTMQELKGLMVNLNHALENAHLRLIETEELQEEVYKLIKGRNDT